MTLPTRLAAYTDCINFLEAALADRAGARTKFEYRSEAYYFQMRVQQARKMLRADSRLEYKADDQRYDTCEFDCLTVRIKYEDEMHWVYAERNNVDLQIEPLTPQVVKAPT